MLPTELTTILQTALDQRVFPGLVFALAAGPPDRRQRLVQAAGHLFAPEWQPPDRPAMEAEVVFDLASLTKPLATVLGILCLKQRGLLDLDAGLAELLGRRMAADKAAIRLRQLLSHSSGLPAHRPYFEQLRLLPVAERQEAMLELILAEPLEAPPGERAIYSDLGYILLGRIIEERAGEPLDAFVGRWLYAPLGLADTIVYRPLGRPCPAGIRVAPTENCPWRRRVVQGEVHDDNAFVLGGVAGHAGLFASAGAVLTLSRHLLDMVLGRAGHPNLAASDLQAAVQPGQGPVAGTWGLGFDTPSAVGSSVGRRLSRRSFGHLGFTGTSFWCDPEADLSVVLLTNRVHPSRHNSRIRDFRPRFHDAVAGFPWTHGPR